LRLKFEVSHKFASHSCSSRSLSYGESGNAGSHPHSRPSTPSMTSTMNDPAQLPPATTTTTKKPRTNQWRPVPKPTLFENKVFHVVPGLPKAYEDDLIREIKVGGFEAFRRSFMTRTMVTTVNSSTLGSNWSLFVSSRLDIAMGRKTRSRSNRSELHSSQPTS
jgi:hypothetical protein